MNLSHSLKIIIGAATLWLLVYPLLFIGAIFLPLLTFDPEGAVPFPAGFGLIFPFHCITMVLQVGLLIFYLVHIIKKQDISDTIRILFGVGIFFLSFVIMPLYFFFFIWSDTVPDWAKDQKRSETPTEPEDITLLKAQEKPAKKSLTPILGWGLALLAIFAVAIWGAIHLMTQLQDQMMQNLFPEPEALPLYETLPLYEGDELPFYRPVEGSQFTLLNNFKGISMWSNYNEIPLLVHNNDLLFAGLLEDTEGFGSLNFSLISADVDTGAVNWQAATGSTMLLKDAEQIYAEAPTDFFVPAGLSAYEVDTGEQIWETRFNMDDAAVLSHAYIDGQTVVAETSHHGNGGVYQIDKQTGAIQTTTNDLHIYGRDEVQHYAGLVFQKQGYGAPSSLVVREEATNEIVWRSQETIVSNVAVGGEITYFLTDKVQLIAVDSYTGEWLGVLSFAPRFPQHFDFVNTSLIVAAEEDIVAIYFEDSQQLSVFQFQTEDN